MTKKEFEEKWVAAFAADVNKAKLKKHVLSPCNYIWHVFSWELIPADRYLEGDEARRAYNLRDKSGAEIVIMDWGKDDVYGEVSEDTNSAAKLDKMTEVYIVGRDLGWTYIKTHEGDDCGPYYMEKKGQDAQ